MEWREQSAVSCDEAYLEAQRWIEVSGEGGGLGFFFTFVQKICKICIFLSNNKIDQSGSLRYGVDFLCLTCFT